MSTFKTHPIHLDELLRKCECGKVQLPDFQRSWVWDEDGIRSLLASVSQSFPVGALMTLGISRDTDGKFAHRPLQGVTTTSGASTPDELLLDGQQRMTSLYQTCLRREVVRTITSKGKRVYRWFYIDILKAVDPGEDRENAIVSVPEDKRLKSDFNRKIDLDLSKSEFEYKNLMFPVNLVFSRTSYDDWWDEFNDYWRDRNPDTKLFRRFKHEVLNNFRSYQLPVITLNSDTAHEAVCIVFEKVNTKGEPLTAFELVTAMYAARGHRLRNDWFGTPDQPGLQARLRTYGRAADQEFGVLEKVEPTEILQCIALVHGAEKRRAELSDGRKPTELSAVRATRQSILSTPLEDYKKHRAAVEEGFKKATQFLRQNHIFRVKELPYQTQLVPLAAILAIVDSGFDHTTVRDRIARWFWCGIFGELYGSAVETRFARDVIEVPAWLAGGPEPSTVTEGHFRPERLLNLRSRLSAAYKGIHALMLARGAIDFRSGQRFDQTVFFDEDVDIHHIFPKKWCEDKKMDKKVFDSVINKTPLSKKTNRILGGSAPSIYLKRLEAGGKNTPEIPGATLNNYLASHAIDPDLLRADNFIGFMKDREQQILQMISEATGHPIRVSNASFGEHDDDSQYDDYPDPHFIEENEKN